MTPLASLSRASLRWGWVLVLAAAVLVLFSQPGAVMAQDAAEAAAEAAYRAVNAELVEHHVLPRYTALVTGTAALQTQAQSFCGATTAAGLTAFRAAVLNTMDAWQGVQHVRFGPIEMLLRIQRFAFWPDPRNSTPKQVQAVIAKQDPHAIDERTFATGSVAVQGLPALELLLFEHGADAGAEAFGTGSFHCAYMLAITSNLAGMAQGILSDWTGGDIHFAKVVAYAGGEDGHYQAPEEATLDLFKSLYTAVELVADHKLKRPLGESAQAANPALAESGASGHSLDNIRANLAAAQALYEGEGGKGFSHLVLKLGEDAKLDALMRRAFRQTRATADAVQGALVDGVSDPGQRPKLLQLQKEASALKQLLVERVSRAAGIQVGFNALDGD